MPTWSPLERTIRCDGVRSRVELRHPVGRRGRGRRRRRDRAARRGRRGERAAGEQEGRRRASWGNALESARALCLALACGAFAARGAAGRRPTAPTGPSRCSWRATPRRSIPRYAVDSVGLRATRLVHAGPRPARSRTLSPHGRTSRSRGAGSIPSPSRSSSVTTCASTRAPLCGPRTWWRRCAPSHRPASPLDTRASSPPSRSPTNRASTASSCTCRALTPRCSPTSSYPSCAQTRPRRLPAPDGTLDGLGPYAIGTRRTRRVLLVPADAGARSRDRPTPSSFARFTTRTRARCGSRPDAPTSP